MSQHLGSLSGLEGREWSPSPLRRVDIVAMGHSALEFVIDCYHQPPREKDHQVWTINSGPLCFQHDMVWNMHDLSKLHTKENEVDYRPLYKDLTKPLVTVRAMEELPTSLDFPIAKCVELFKTNYFANTVAYMVAGALMCGVEELRIYGADYNYPGKEAYEKGRASVEYWLGIAHMQGVKVVIAKTSTLMDMRHRLPGQKGAIGYGEVYGYFDEQPEFNEQGQITGFKKPWVEVEDGNNT